VPGVATTGEIGWGLTPAVLANVLVQGLRFALPWIILLSAAARMFERRPDDAPDGSRRLVLDLAALLAIRGAALILAMWVWWPSAWWVTTARAVFAFATGDLLLVLASAFTIGVFARVPAGYSAAIRPSTAGVS
jgi:MFS family permease